ncbi:MAG: MFS transporter [Kineosporiaceae bacterium]|nr:MFS transporter [Kineosporiaceae bacterium]
MGTPSPWSRPHRATTAAIVAVTLLVAFEAYAVVTAMPVAARALGGLREYGLAFSLFVTTALLGIVGAGELVGRRGPAVTMLLGLVTFGVGLTISGTATTFATFLAGRALSGLGGGVHMVCLYVLVGAAFAESLQPRVFGLISASWVLPSLIGPPVAGLLATHVGWQAPFLAVLPLLPAPLWVLWTRLRAVGVASGAPGAASSGGGRRRLGAAVLLAGGAGCLQWAQWALTADAAPGVLVAALGAGGAAVMLAGLPRLLPSGVFRAARGLPALVVHRTGINAAFFGSEAFLTLMLVEHRGVSPALAGVALTFGAIGWFAGSWSQGHWPGGSTGPSGAERPDRYRLVSIGGLLIGAALTGLAFTPLTWVPPVLVAPIWVVAGLGMGWAMSCSSVLLLRLAPAAEQGRSAAAVQIGDNLGSMIGIGGAGALFAAAYRPGEVTGAGVFAAIWLLLALAGLGAGVVARRIRPVAPPVNGSP